MAFRDFKFLDVVVDLGLASSAADLFTGVEPLIPRTHLLETLAEGQTLALAIHAEKARSEFMIAPVLLELRRLTGESFGLFSGTTFDVDPARGLNGVCDFILTRSKHLYILSAPLVAIAEGKNDDTRAGFGQCIAAMFAARLFNERAGAPIPVIHGVCTTGSAWKFLRLEGDALTIDLREYYIDNVGLILAILRRIVTAP